LVPLLFTLYIQGVLKFKKILFLPQKVKARISSPPRFGDRIPVGDSFSAQVHTGPGVHPASCTMGTEFFPVVKSGRGVKLTLHPLLLPWPRKSRAIPLSPYVPYSLYSASVTVQRWTLPIIRQHQRTELTSARVEQ